MPNGICCEGYIAPSMVWLIYQFQAATCSGMLEALVLVLFFIFVTLNIWSGRKLLDPTIYIYIYSGVGYRGGRGLGVQPPPPSRNSEDIGGVLDRMSKKSRRLDFLSQFTVFSYGCNLLNKNFF